jgi:hypothetical protein
VESSVTQPDNVQAPCPRKAVDPGLAGFAKIKGQILANAPELLRYSQISQSSIKYFFSFMHIAQLELVNYDYELPQIITKIL